ncbi:hypothetical protein BG015_010118 [Linnemannia schmuckeri]|uniref:FAD-binding domain-containing protein n=1 Tax=Linnemannia schmuckeri TaxID=64567 RepID=A0A9P5S7J6_9FUNG|nr:hypothetical protein BG015_010118 [Linnemannia schmuckeri]
MTVSFVVMPMLQQLGILDEVVAAGKRGTQSCIFNEKRERIYVIDYEQTIQMTGYEGYIISRPALYNILLSHVPTHRILRCKRVASIDQDTNPSLATVTCADGSSYSAQILVGADGAHSIVRKSLYSQLVLKDKLPMSDRKELKFKSVCLVGQTEVLDAKVFPEIEEPLCTVQFTVGDDKPYTSYSVSEKDTYSRSNRNSVASHRTSIFSNRTSSALDRSSSIQTKRSSTILDRSPSSSLLKRASTILSYSPSSVLKRKSSFPNKPHNAVPSPPRVTSAAADEPPSPTTTNSATDYSFAFSSSKDSSTVESGVDGAETGSKSRIRTSAPPPQSTLSVTAMGSDGVDTRNWFSTFIQESHDWGLAATEAMSNEVRNYAIASGDGKTMMLADLIDRTPKDQITKVMLEEKLFKTWYSGRVVLLGDACHKMNPSGGLGAMNAMQDALTLANWLNVLPSSSKPDLEDIFKEYKKERYPIAKAGFKHSQQYSRLYGKAWSADITRAMMKNMPGWLFTVMMKRLAGNRPIISFMAPPEDKGSVKPWPQRSLIKTHHLASVRTQGAAV